MKDALESFWREPKIPQPPARHRWDVVLVVVVVGLGLLGSAFEPDLVWRPVAAVLAVALPLSLLWRRSHSFAVVLITFLGQAIVDTASFVVDDGTTITGGTILVGVILTYALWRWASGRQAVAGMVVVLATHIVSGLATPEDSVLESVLSSTVWLFPAALGAAMRYRATIQSRRVVEARLEERQQLARELHDTVAHHVSAIAIQAQAGRAVADSRPEAAAEVLATIEESASRTLDEMRQLVGLLRDDEEAARAPHSGIADIVALGKPNGEPAIDVSIGGDLEGLSPTVQASLYRITQESVTNARRHARNATRVSVTVTGHPDEVHLTVSDDGDRPTGAGPATGYGLVGMAERVEMLGGTFDAAPGPARGWLVEATLPRAGVGA